MSQAFNLSQFANKLNTSGEIGATTGITGTFPTSNLPTIPINKGGTNLTTVGSNGTVVQTDGSAYTYGSVSGTLTWDTVKTSGFTAVAGYGYFVNTTSAAITVTLPASPSVGNIVVIVDYAGTSATNNISVDPNGSKINSTTGNAILQTNRQGITFVYIDSTQGWLAQSNVYKSDTPFIRPVSISYLVVAGGGQGGTYNSGGCNGGGGGAGGLQSGTATLTPSSVYTITVGAGGSGGTSSSVSGNNSVLSGSGITTVTSTGGGGGGGRYPGDSNGKSGGSGGGAGSDSRASGGAGTSGQGNNGGTAATNAGGGGGGANAVGSNAGSGAGGAGGSGTASSITGSSVTYAGGGGGGSYPSNGGAGGSGGGGKGTDGTAQNQVAGTANTGGGGGGNIDASAGAQGGSGVVILSVPTAQYSGTSTGSPTVTTSGSNTILKYTSSGTYTA